MPRKEMPLQKLRLESAAAALDKYVFVKDRELFTYLHEDDQKAAISDLIADLLHYAEMVGEDPEQRLELAKDHYREEKWENEQALKEGRKP